MIAVLSPVISALQLLAQRQNLADKDSKPRVAFYMEQNLHTVSVQMLVPAAETGKPMVFNVEHKATGDDYADAARNLALKLLEPLRLRQSQDQHVLNLADAIKTEGEAAGAEESDADSDSFPVPTIR